MEPAQSNTEQVLKKSYEIMNYCHQEEILGCLHLKQIKGNLFLLSKNTKCLIVPAPKMGKFAAFLCLNITVNGKYWGSGQNI